MQSKRIQACRTSRVSCRIALAAIAFTALVAVVPTIARAQFQTGPIAAGYGGAGRASADAAESSFLNPAALSQIQKYNLAIGYQVGSHPADGQRTNYSGLIADGSPDRIVPGSLAFVHRFTEPSPSGGAYTEQDVAIAVSAFVLPRLSLGLGAHRQMYRPSTGEEGAQNNATLGALYAISQSFGIGAVAYDIVPVDVAVPRSIRQMPIYALGMQWIASEFFRMRLDVVRPTEGPRNGRTNVMAGFETQFRPRFVFRGGGQWRETDDRMLVTTGFGIRGPRLSVEYAFEKDVRVAGGVRHMVDLWIPLW